MLRRVKIIFVVLIFAFFVSLLMMFCACYQEENNVKTRGVCSSEGVIPQDIFAPIGKKGKVQIGHIEMNTCYIEVQNSGAVEILIVSLTGIIDGKGGLNIRFGVVRGESIVIPNLFFKGKCVGRVGYKLTEKSNMKALPDAYIFKPKLKQ